MDGRGLQLRDGWEESLSQSGVGWEELWWKIWVGKGAGQTRDGGLATQAPGAALRTPRGSFWSPQPPLLTSLEKGLGLGGS